MKIDHLTEREVFMIIVGLERLRDDNADEARRIEPLPYRDPDFKRKRIRGYRAESDEAEVLRVRIRDTTDGYR